jgi:hypothetical protein
MKRQAETQGGRGAWRDVRPTLADLPNEVVGGMVAPFLTKLEAHAVALVARRHGHLRATGGPAEGHPRDTLGRLRWCMVCDKPWGRGPVRGVVHEACAGSPKCSLEGALEVAHHGEIYRQLEGLVADTDGMIPLYMEVEDDYGDSDDEGEGPQHHISFEQVMGALAAKVYARADPATFMKNAVATMESNYRDYVEYVQHSLWDFNSYTDAYECPHRSASNELDIILSGLIEGPDLQEHLVQLHMAHAIPFIAREAADASMWSHPGGYAGIVMRHLKDDVDWYDIALNVVKDNKIKLRGIFEGGPDPVIRFACDCNAALGELVRTVVDTCQAEHKDRYAWETVIEDAEFLALYFLEMVINGTFDYNFSKRFREYVIKTDIDFATIDLKEHGIEDFDKVK